MSVWGEYFSPIACAAIRPFYVVFLSVCLCICLFVCWSVNLFSDMLYLSVIWQGSQPRAMKCFRPQLSVELVYALSNISFSCSSSFKSLNDLNLKSSQNIEISPDNNVVTIWCDFNKSLIYETWKSTKYLFKVMWNN